MTFAPSLFNSFFLAGFECATQRRRDGRRLDLLAATRHDELVEQDYRQVMAHGLRTARDGLRWHLIETTPGRYDWSSFLPMLRAANANGMQVIWDLCHYGWPDDLDILSTAFVDRFAAFSRAVAKYLREQSDDVQLFTPVNEISFFAWAAGEVGWFHPHAHGRGPDVKRQLIRACIASIEAIHDVDARSRIVTVEPLIHVVPPKGKPDVDGMAAAYRNSQFEAWDMLSGAMSPELGGQPRYLDVMGVNFYHDNQWEHPGGRKIAWHIHPRDPRWVPFHKLLLEAHTRYQRPIFVGETSHVGVGRAEWIREMSDELCLAIDAGVPLEGICLYPIMDRFEWEDPTHWHNSGLWDYELEPNGDFRRVLNAEYAAELLLSQEKLARKGYGRAITPRSQGACLDTRV
jgi:beta-glucosidase/6-phospho-beta-glucosidase/beta-galactosidase